MREEPLYLEDVQEGQELPQFVRVTDLMNWNRYAAVNDEFVYIHMDEEAGKAAGMKGVFGMGNVRYAYLHNMVRDWIGLHGEIRKLGIQYRGINYKNDKLTCKGRVTKKYLEDKQHLVDLDLLVENQAGENIAPGTATVVLPTRSR